MSDALFDPGQFRAMVAYQMRARGKSQHQVCGEAGLTRATLCRVLAGKSPSVETYLRIKRWIEGGAS
ncbi:hypothetical protein [Novosphingobium sp. HII-3]|uniref:hypothetical protein n=1 Tax=Novosphingobium sp. HII-3 TaxID=2075565 RepID=UPI000CDA6747|nr:hypothetical protein [Novosphingobium sp. HII-3]